MSVGGGTASAYFSLPKLSAKAVCSRRLTLLVKQTIRLTKQKLEYKRVGVQIKEYLGLELE